MVPIFFHVLQNLFVVLAIITLLCITDLFVLDVSCLTTYGVISGFLYSPGSNTWISFAGFLIFI